VGIVAVVYDLIPLTHPQFCDENLVRVFDHWFGWVARTADGFVAISQTISEQVRQDVSRRMGPQAGALKWHGYFRLGSDLDQGQTSGLVRKPVLSMFSQGLPVYLMVSTIEPRKNHVYLVNAFEKIWANGGQVALCIVGKVGWKCAELVHRITQHPELGKRLFMFNDLSDTELERCYQQSRALMFPSFVEGFGLPLVEAMQRGLPAFASDIAVFREVGGEFLAYFDIGDPASLAHSVLAFESSGQFPAQKPVSDWAWPGWKESAQELVRVISSHAHRHQR
jgi:alpha-1,2-rhamnosyltransferase